MPLPSALDACKLDMFASEDELKQKYPLQFANRIMRIRDMYNFWLANPSVKDRQLRDQLTSRFGISQSAAYSDIAVIRQLVPLLAKSSRAFHLARYNEMILETYAMAKARKDTKTMERAASSYARHNGVDREDELSTPYQDIVPQPFTATLDVRVLGLNPIPDLYNHIDRLVKELSHDSADILDVDYEDIDLEEDKIFPDKAPSVIPPQNDTD